MMRWCTKIDKNEEWKFVNVNFASAEYVHLPDTYLAAFTCPWTHQSFFTFIRVSTCFRRNNLPNYLQRTSVIFNFLKFTSSYQAMHFDE